MTVKASTPTGNTRGVAVYREGVMHKVRIRIGNEVSRTPSKIYAEVNLDDTEARKLYQELGELLGEGGEA